MNPTINVSETRKYLNNCLESIEWSSKFPSFAFQMLLKYNVQMKVMGATGRCQFHQHLMQTNLIWKYYTKLYCTKKWMCKKQLIKCWCNWLLVSISPTYLHTAFTNVAPNSVRIQSSCLHFLRFLDLSAQKLHVKC